MNEYARIRDVLEQVLDLPESERRGAVDRVTGDDEPLRLAALEAIERLGDVDRAGFLAMPVVEGRLYIASEREPATERTPRAAGYRIDSFVGAGSHGDVYRARSLGPLERDVALKILRPGLPGSVRERFRREQLALASINHPGVAQVYDAGETEDGRPFVAVEWIEGGPITDEAESRSLHWKSRLRLIIEACKAVQHIHAGGILHRDLKPSNILAAELDGSLHPKVIDFGTATVACEGGLRTTLDTLGPRVVGTIAYMAPEQLDGARSDARADVYSLGLITWELLAGAHPFNARDRSLSDLVRAVSREGLEHLPRLPHREQTAANATGPVAPPRGPRAALDAVLDKACRPDPAGRYPSAQHLADDLERVLQNLPVEAQPRSVMRSLRAAVRRRPRTTIAVAVACATLVALGAGLARSTAHNARLVSRQQDTLNQLIDGVLNNLSEISGASPAREQLATLILQRLPPVDGSAPLGDRNDRLRLQHARVLMHLGDVAIQQGRPADAVDLHSRSLEALRPLVTHDGAPSALLNEALVLLVRLGDAHELMGRGVEALEIFTEAHEWIERRLEESPEDRRLRDELCWSLERLAARHYWADRPGLTLELCERRLATAHGLYEEQPESAGARFNLACAHASLAAYLVELGRLGEARPHAEAAVPLLDRLCREQPGYYTYRTRQLSARGTLFESTSESKGMEAAALAEETLLIARQFAEDSKDAWTSTVYLQRAVINAAEAARLSGDATRAAIFEQESRALERVRQQQHDARLRSAETVDELAVPRLP